MPTKAEDMMQYQRDFEDGFLDPSDLPRGVRVYTVAPHRALGHPYDRSGGLIVKQYKGGDRILMDESIAARYQRRGTIELEIEEVSLDAIEDQSTNQNPRKVGPKRRRRAPREEAGRDPDSGGSEGREGRPDNQEDGLAVRGLDIDPAPENVG